MAQQEGAQQVDGEEGKDAAEHKFGKAKNPLADR
jgi:hypothetical protein